ncbi:hypothetical protein ABE137_07535 [Brevibacillus laterosporus]|uniref:hypothetical protein n=1 Tax=Brevibacillus laterosporus TaxID=1465 RepID=UPI003D1EB4C9
MKLANYELPTLYKILYELELTGKQSRMRTRFCKVLGARINETEEEKDKLIRQYAKYDENEQIVTQKNEDGKDLIILKDVATFNRELDILMREDFILDETEERKEMLLTVSDILLNIDTPFSKEDAHFYDRFCEVFENLSFTK